ncbi:MAG: nuclear transport factor 2 family protein [Candidatus Promineifilaceae bacterium]|nr:nuclear transport factor 2 family protein [Candidatus Promineifilaceae bacterium]
MNREVVDDWFNAFRERDISKLKLAEDFVHTSPFGEVKGRETYLDLVRANEEAFFSQPIEIFDVIDGGDRFAVRYDVGGMQACDCIYIRGGEIAEIYAYYHVGKKPTY